MSVVNAAQWQQFILLEVGAGLDSTDPISAKVQDIVTPIIQVLWAAWAEKALIFPRLQYLYCKRHCLEIMAGQMRILVPVTVQGLNLQQDKRLTNVQTLMKDVQGQIDTVEKQAAASRPPALGYLTQKNAIMPRPLQPDPNSRAYRGDALVDDFATQNATLGNQP